MIDVMRTPTEREQRIEELHAQIDQMKLGCSRVGMVPAPTPYLREKIEELKDELARHTDELYRELGLLTHAKNHGGTLDQT